MKFDVSALRYLTRDDFRVLTAIEMGQKNHDIVPVELITQIASLRLGGVGKILSTLLRNKLIHHDRSSFDGYRLTNLGYDYLAIRTFLARDVVFGVGRQIGVGKESDIFIVVNEEEEEMCLKIHRLGRTSFRAIKNKRDYHKSRGSPSWLYLSRLAATKEFTFMKVLKENGFPVPTPIESNRHAIIMSLSSGFPLNQVRKMDNPESIYVQMMELIERFAKHGLIHGDFNEFNILIDSVGTLTVIDFPQMVSIRHPNAKMYFERDVNCVRRFFRKRFNFMHEFRPDFDECLQNIEKELDKIVSASGFSHKMSKEFDRFVEHTNEADDDSNSQESEGEGSQDESQEEPLQLDDGSQHKQVDQEEVDGARANVIEQPCASEEVHVQSSQQKEDDVTSLDNDAVNSDVNSDDVENDDAESLGDGPDAYKALDYASHAPSERVDDIRRRVKRDLTRKAKHQNKKKIGSRNTVKNRTRRKLLNEIHSEM